MVHLDDAWDAIFIFGFKAANLAFGTKYLKAFPACLSVSTLLGDKHLLFEAKNSAYEIVKVGCFAITIGTNKNGRFPTSGIIC